jgi:integrase
VSVAAKTHRTDQALQRLVPTGLQAMQVAAVSEREVARSFETLIQHGLSERSVVRYRARLSSCFAWRVREKIIVRNPVTGTKVPRSSEEPTEMRPWTDRAGLERLNDPYPGPHRGPRQAAQRPGIRGGKPTGCPGKHH